MSALRLLTLALLCLQSGTALAHGGEDHNRSQWTFDPFVVAPLLVCGALYVTGIVRLWSRAGRGRGVRAWRVLLYAGGWLALATALVSPLHWAGEQLFTFHMVEHEILMAVAAPLVVLGRPAGAVLWAVPRRLRLTAAQVPRTPALRYLWAWLVRPVNATFLHGGAIWIWHEPHLLNASVSNVAVHRLQHLSFLITALLFWWALVRSHRYGAAVCHVFLTMLHMSLLGAFLALSPRVLYVAQTDHATDWGLSPLEDQQLAGLIMWVPAGTIYAVAALVFAALWIRRSPRRQSLVPAPGRGS
jgi:cytochrome c oxidase assembly factor CtaG